MISYKHIILCIMFLSITHTLWSYLLIKNFDKEDPGFRLYEDTLKTTQDKPTFFEYQLKENETLLSIAQKHKLSISSLISLNASYNIDLLQEGAYILISSLQGVFLSLNPKNDLEYLIYNRLFSTLTKELPIVVKSQYSTNKTTNTFYFIKNTALTKLEYELWTRKSFHMPVLKGYVSSPYGYRISPISGRRLLHKGIDIATKSGSQVFASRGGTVIHSGYSNVYGYFIIIQHDEEYKTLYGHLLDSIVEIDDIVYAGQHIAFIGNTGASTGNHLHFEIHKNNQAIPPLNLLLSKE